MKLRVRVCADAYLLNRQREAVPPPGFFKLIPLRQQLRSRLDLPARVHVNLQRHPFLEKLVLEGLVLVPEIRQLCFDVICRNPKPAKQRSGLDMTAAGAGEAWRAFAAWPVPGVLFLSVSREGRTAPRTETNK